MSNRIDFNDLLKWSLNYQESYPTGPTGNSDDVDDNWTPRQLSDEDQRFLMDAMDHKVMDEQKRVKVLLQVMRLPQDPTLLYYMSCLEKIMLDEKIQQNNNNNLNTGENENGKNNNTDSSSQTTTPTTTTTTTSSLLSSLKALHDKDSLHTLMDMRYEDEKRKKMGLDIIGAEYVPGNVLTLTEIVKKSLILSTLSTYPSLTDIDLGPDVEDPLVRRNELRKERMIEVTKIVEDKFPSYLQSILSQIPPPTDEQLRSIYNIIREQKLDTIEEIEDRTHRADNAIGFVTFNGIPILKQYLLSSDYEIASESWRLLGSIVSNQPLCQQKAIEYNLIPLAIEALNITRYIPSLLSSYAFSSSNSTNNGDFVPANTHYGGKKNTNENSQDGLGAKINEILARSAPLLPQNRPAQVKLTPEQFNVLLEQYNITGDVNCDENDHEKSTDLTKKTKKQLDILYKFTHFGNVYPKHILNLIKSVLFFLTSVCNNNSTAQTQFMLHHGFVPISHLLQLGKYFILDEDFDKFFQNDFLQPDKSTKNLPNFTKNTKNVKNTKIVSKIENKKIISPEKFTPASELIISLISSYGSIFKQILRRVLQLLTLLVDDEYKISTSAEICSYLFKNAHVYHHIATKDNISTNNENNNNDKKNIENKNDENTTSTLSPLHLPGTDIFYFIPSSSQQYHSSNTQTNKHKKPSKNLQECSLSQSLSHSINAITSISQHNTDMTALSDNDDANAPIKVTSPRQQDNDSLIQPSTLSQQSSNLSTRTNTSSIITNMNEENDENIDEGHQREYFQDPIAPLRLENPDEIHPAFKLKHNLTGGKLSSDGDHVETQFYLSPFASLFIPIFFPFILWEAYLNANEFDREIVVMTERMLMFTMKNAYKLKSFGFFDENNTNNNNNALDQIDEDNVITNDDNGVDDSITKNTRNTIVNQYFQHNFTTPTVLNEINTKFIQNNTNNGKPNPDEIANWLENEFLQGQKVKMGKFSTFLHDVLINQYQIIYQYYTNEAILDTDGNSTIDTTTNNNNNKNIPNNKNGKKVVNSPTKTTSIKDIAMNAIISGIFDNHTKKLLSKVGTGPKPTQDQQREWNKQEMQFISVIKDALNQ